MTKDAKNLESIQLLADRYADELTAQFRTLNLFVQHAGEVGRAHEVFLRDVLRRFLPGGLRVGTGFIASPDSVTRQQDIVIFDPHSLPILLQIGDCVVVDRDAVAATIEVKTTVVGQDLHEALDKLAELRASLRGSCAVGLYAWEGPSLAVALGILWERFRGGLELGGGHLPDALYVRGRYLVVPNHDGRLDSAPLLALRLGDGQHPEGAGLLSLVERLWLVSSPSRRSR